MFVNVKYDSVPNAVLSKLKIFQNIVIRIKIHAAINERYAVNLFSRKYVFFS